MNDIEITEIKPLGDSAVEIHFGDKIDIEINRVIHSFDMMINTQKEKWLVETIPAYCTLTIIYNPVVCDYFYITHWITTLATQFSSSSMESPKIIEIPVHYGGEYGPDLAEVAKLHQLSDDQVIELHSSRIYHVYMMGFMPGFPYLGGLDPLLETPRLKSPRLSIPAGSVGLAGKQTGIYPVNSPGGWRIVGRTDLALFDPSSENHFLLKPGNLVKFISIQSE